MSAALAAQTPQVAQHHAALETLQLAVVDAPQHGVYSLTPFFFASVCAIR
jgi:hypothetical protein